MTLYIPNLCLHSTWSSDSVSSTVMILSMHFSPATATAPKSTAAGAGAMTGAGANAAGSGATPKVYKRTNIYHFLKQFQTILNQGLPKARCKVRI